jgi:DNA-binding phage protein
MNFGGTYGIRCLKPGTALLVPILLLVLMAGSAISASPVGEPMLFKTPEAAAEALLAAFKNNDDEALAAVFGAKYRDRLLSKDKAAARESRERLYQAAQKSLTFRKDTADRVVLVIGPEAWPFPIPLVRSGDEWRFQTAEGIEEIVNRRIGANERDTIALSRDYLIAQREYAGKIRDSSGVRKFAQRIVSSPGKQDGLYWDPTIAGGEESPFGPRVAEFLASGRQPREPYHGYYFRILTRQGSHVPGGRYNYVINGNMIAGFALVAFPADYGNSGIMTFLVSHQGKVYQKDLGRQTRKIAKQMREFNPDGTWTEVKE